MTTSQSNVQVQWTLDSTVNNGLSVARGLMQAATTDNVQPIAMMACEKFGMTLPICLETRLAIESIAHPPKTSHMLNFIKAQIGYLSGDSTEYLSRNEGGIRFLVLAAALCTLSSFEAAQVVAALLKATAKGDQFLPTVPQLKALFEALRIKLQLSSFVNNVVGWELYCSESPFPEEYSIGKTLAPPIKSVEELVMAVSRCGRLGESCYILIRCTAVYIPWSIAFIKWHLGVPPAVQILDEF